jgi:outer membrane receptor protein involved in Fe transport
MCVHFARPSAPASRVRRFSPATLSRVGVSALLALCAAPAGFAQTDVGTGAASSSTGSPGPAPATTSGDDEVFMLDDLAVTSDVVRGSAADLANVRLKADVSINFLSADDLAKFSAGDAAEALIRIPGVSVAGGEFAVIRGLSDRYANTLLNGLKLPSPDPEKQAVQLDLFPSNLIDSIVVSKTFMPDLWGDSSGGSVNLGTKIVPDARTGQISVGLSANDSVLGKDIPVDPAAGRADWIGRGASDRAPRPPVGFGSREQVPIVPDTETGRIGEKISFSYGDRIQLKDDIALGFTLAAVQETDVDLRQGERSSLFWRVTPGPIADRRLVSVPSIDGTSDFVQSETTGSLAGLLGLGLEFGQDHRLGFVGLYSQSGISTVERQTDVGPSSSSELSDADDDGVRDYRWFNDTIAYRERNLTALQLQGEHTLRGARDLGVTWALQSASTYQDEPGLSEAGYGQVINDPGPSGITVSGPATVGDYFLSSNNGVIRPLSQAWSRTDEDQVSGRLDFTLPFESHAQRESQLKFGGAFERAERTFDGQVETYSPGAFFFGPSPQPLYDSRLGGPGPSNSTTSAATGDRRLEAGYLMVSYGLPRGFTLAAGVRLESFRLASSGSGQFGNLTSTDFYNAFQGILGTTPDRRTTAINEDDLLPAASLTWNPRERLFFRVGVSETIARPSFREIGPYFSQSLETGNLVLGNPALGTSSVRNFDVRVERYFGEQGRDLAAFTVFTKRIDQPIEKVVFPTTEGPVETWLNNPGEAEMRGFEIELKKNLGFLGEPMRAFTLSGNFTAIDAEVPIEPSTAAGIANFYNLLPPDQRPSAPTTRRLFDQPEWIFNTDLTWEIPSWKTEVVLSYFRISEVLTVTGSATSTAFFYYDSFEREYDRLDLGITRRFGDGWSVRLQAKNLTDPVRGLVYDGDSPAGGANRVSYRAGRDYSVSISKKF